MESSNAEGFDGLLTVDVNYSGSFVPKPLLYEAGLVQTVRDVDFASMTYDDFVGFMGKLTCDRFDSLFYCIPGKTLVHGLRNLNGNEDFKEFLSLGYEKGGRISVYVEMYGYPVNEWIQEDSEVDDEPEEVDGRQKRLTDPFLYLICPDEPEGMQRDVEEGVQRDVEEGVQGDDEDIDVASDESLNVEEEGDAEEGQEEGEEAKRKIVYPMHDPNENWRKMKPILGMRFENPEQLKYCLSNYAVANGYALYYERNEQRSILCRCGKKTEGVTCPFRCWATWMSTERSFQIKSLNPEHTCSRNFTLGSIVTYHWIAKQYVKTLIENPQISLRAMAADVKEKFNINVTLGQCRRAKDKAMKDIEGNLIDHYARLWDYATEIKRSNPGSTVSLEVNTMPDGSNYFSRFYVCFKALRDGWIEGCRNVIGLDGGFLKGFCTGELISAIGRDGNNQMFPIAWAVVCVENKDNWTWFLNLLVDDLELEDGYGLTVMSDQHKV